MPNNKEIDDYISKKPAFAKPILEHLRMLIHEVYPEVQETIKWGCPHYVGKNGILISTAAFKQHCGVNFSNWQLIPGLAKTANDDSASAGQLGKILSLSDLPSDKILKRYIKQTVELSKEKTKSTAKPTANVIEIPPSLLKALSKNKIALKKFEAFTANQRKEYASWINEAKTDDTRNKRITTAVEWIGEGKTRNWKYQKKEK